jgi:ribosome biogenesis GTPase / thiamine phosphate phosphatase
MSILADIGFDAVFTGYEPGEKDEFTVGRVISEYRERYRVLSSAGEYMAEITGKLRFSSAGREDFPAVGDFVLFVPFDNDQAVIHEVLPRKTVLERKSVSVYGEKQLIGANIDFACIILATDRDFNLNRLDRYIAIAISGGIKPVAFLSKTDLITSELLLNYKELITKRHKNIEVFSFSNPDRSGLAEIEKFLQKGKTYCFLGSSGVGKSTLINNLIGEEYFVTNNISDSTGKGRHTTTYRELFILGNGAMVIDNPGMRELGVSGAEEGYEKTFDEITGLAKKCRFDNCTHSGEPGCEVIKAIEENRLDEKILVSYKKIRNETIRVNSTIAEKRKKDKDFGKMVKAVLKGNEKRSIDDF